MSAFYKRNTRAAKLTPTMVQQIREQYASGSYSQGSLARAYKISIGQIGRIVRGESWQDTVALAQPTAMDLEEQAKRVLRAQQEFLGQIPTDPLAGGGPDEPPAPVMERLKQALADRDPDGLIAELTRKKPDGSSNT